MTYHIGEPKGATIQIKDKTEGRIRYLLNAKSGNIANLNNTIQEKDGDDQLVTITGMAFPIRRSFFFFLFFSLLYFCILMLLSLSSLLFILFFFLFFLAFPFLLSFSFYSYIFSSFPPFLFHFLPFLLCHTYRDA